MKIMYPTVSIHRYDNGWSYSIVSRYEETTGVCTDKEPLVLRFYVEGKARTMVLTLAEES